KNKNIQPPDGYTKYPQELNERAGGEYIYLCYHKDLVNILRPEASPQCISEFTFVKGDADAPDGYTKVDVDLNRGAGGDYIYLCYKKAPYKVEDAIKDISIISGESAEISPPHGFTKIPQDLNEKAGGKYIYLCYSKTA